MAALSVLMLFVCSYLLNPFVVLTCIAKSSAVFHNAILADAILAMLKGTCRILYVEYVFIISCRYC